MARIQINPEKLESAAGKLRELGESLREEKGQMSTVSGNIESAWKSQSTAAFLESMETAENNMEQLARATDILVRNLLSLAETARRIEQQNSSDFLDG